MTGNQAPPARAGLTAPHAATARPHDPAGHHATSTVSISPIFGNGDIVTGVRGATDGDVILTGSHATARAGACAAVDGDETHDI